MYRYNTDKLLITTIGLCLNYSWTATLSLQLCCIEHECYTKAIYILNWSFVGQLKNSLLSI